MSEIKDKSPISQRIVKDLRLHRHEVNFVEHNGVPDGYMTGDEFRKRAIAKVNIFCDRHGLL